MMKMIRTIMVCLTLISWTYTFSQSRVPGSPVHVVGAMRDVMWKGNLESVLSIDTLARTGIYGLGPARHLKGELLIVNGNSFISRIEHDSVMRVETNVTTGAPFFVYTHVKDWTQQKLPDSIRTIKELEQHLDQQTLERKRPFAFRLTGHVPEASIHVQDLPAGTQVHSPQDAHRGQKTFSIKNEMVEIVGFFSTAHQGIFTHHDSFLHMHLITAVRNKMGHLDEIRLGRGMILFLPKD